MQGNFSYLGGPGFNDYGYAQYQNPLAYLNNNFNNFAAQQQWSGTYPLQPMGGPTQPTQPTQGFGGRLQQPMSNMGGGYGYAQQPVQQAVQSPLAQSQRASMPSGAPGVSGFGQQSGAVAPISLSGQTVWPGGDYTAGLPQQEFWRPPQRSQDQNFLAMLNDPRFVGHLREMLNSRRP